MRFTNWAPMRMTTSVCAPAWRAGRWLCDPGVFVFNHASKTFEENQIDHDEWLFRNEKLFLERASCLSRSLSPAPRKRAAPSTSVIVAVGEGAPGEGAAERLTDSLTSLANQTVTGFETVLVSRHEQELPNLPAELVRDLRIRRVTVPGDVQAGLGALWNAGVAAAQGDFLTYLPAGDIYFPYHLEILHRRCPRTSARRRTPLGAWRFTPQQTCGARRLWNSKPNRNVSCSARGLLWCAGCIIAPACLETDFARTFRPSPNGILRCV